MKLLFNLEVIEGNRVRARPSDYLNSLEPQGQLAAVREFLAWAEQEVAGNSDPQARAEAEIGIATARQFLDRLEQTQARIITDPRGSQTHD
ncbi:MAG: hypothetical protein WBQ78_10855 [Gammaproteobacteria bacterium]